MKRWLVAAAVLTIAAITAALIVLDRWASYPIPEEHL